MKSETTWRSNFYVPFSTQTYVTLHKAAQAMQAPLKQTDIDTSKSFGQSVVRPPVATPLGCLKEENSDLGDPSN